MCAASFAATGQPASGAACTANEAQAAGVRFYPATNTGLGNFMENELVKPLLPAFKEAKSRQAGAVAAQACKDANKAGKDAICAAFGMAADCGFCDVYQ